MYKMDINLMFAGSGTCILNSIELFQKKTYQHLRIVNIINQYFFKRRNINFKFATNWLRIKYNYFFYYTINYSKSAVDHF